MVSRPAVTGAWGSSPLTRGALQPVRQPWNHRRLIPAHAGSTISWGTSRSLSRAHPRSRGEHPVLADMLTLAAGSSPLTRGALVLLDLGRTNGGLIPAHAGSTNMGHGSYFPSRAHPRSRGEHTGEPLEEMTAQGSSPLTRGAQLAKWMPSSTDRLIPAHAGSTPDTLELHPDIEAHPRSRGEHYPLLIAPLSVSGSSPLTRGALAWPARGWFQVGLIPAHAGSTARLTPMKSPLSAHPRSRGEHVVGSNHASPGLGSSPLTRGALGRWWLGLGRVGLIPAHAGSTS